MAIEDDYIVVICPNCGSQMDVPYVYDGTYEVRHGLTYSINGEIQSDDGCQEAFFIAILNGRLHVHGSKAELDNILNKYFKS